MFLGPARFRARRFGRHATHAYDLFRDLFYYEAFLLYAYAIRATVVSRAMRYFTASPSPFAVGYAVLFTSDVYAFLRGIVLCVGVF